LYLDKGFSGVPVLKYLRRCQQAALIACPIRGKKGGTRALCRGRASYRTSYAFNEGKEEEFTAQLAVCRVFTTSRRTKRGKRRAGDFGLAGLAGVGFCVQGLLWTGRGEGFGNDTVPVFSATGALGRETTCCAGLARLAPAVALCSSAWDFCCSTCGCICVGYT